jgi:predicted phage terminase large subunit-like protein
MLNTETPELYNALYRQDLASFIGRSVEITHPNTRYIPNWHIELIGEYLEACTRGELTRLIINMPPRYMKSHAVSVAWPAWLLGHDPARRIVAASYSSAIALKHSVDARALVQSEWYRLLFPQLKLSKDQNQKTKFMTAQRGFRLATSVGGAMTGEGGEFMIVDDPHSAIQVGSANYRKRAVNWFQNTFMTRQDDLSKGCYVVVMQRLHAEDLSGVLLEKGGWEHLMIPAIETVSRTYHFGNATYARMQEELLHPVRDCREAYERLQRDIGSHQFAAQYQQQPVAAKGKLIRRAWLRYTRPEEQEGQRIQSWDTAIKAGEGNDFSVGLTWKITKDHFVLEEMQRAALEYPELKKLIIEQAEKYQPQVILIEDKASGQSLIQELKNLTRLPIIGINPKGDKTQRLLRVIGLFEAGKILLPQAAPWLADYERELLSFPDAAHDDMVDATTQFLNWALAREKQQNSWRIRVL